MQFQRRLSSAIRFRPALILAVLVALGTLVLAACGGDDDEDTNNGSDGATGTPKLSGSINGDGSSTVFPITEAVAEEFGKIHDVAVTVGISGTGGGFEKFCNGETDFNDASRPIKDEEKEACAANGVEFVEFEVAFDGLSLVVNPENDFADCLTVEELKAIWEPESSVDNWNQVRDDFPDRELKDHLYGAGTDSGTFDYFTAEIVGEEGASRSDYTASEDDNQLVLGVAGDDNALGYFGFAYYVENQDQLRIVAVDNGAGCVEPSQETIESGEYAPLSRPLFVYVAKDALARPEVAEFMRFYLTEGPALAAEVGYVAAPQATYDEGLAKLP
jgi:phosphate transport system substrate-binding protein